MELHADFTRLALVHAARTPWLPSPMAGVERRMLDRVGGEVARATSIVRYAPGSRFSPHVHTGGEEFLVLEGMFEDEHGAFGPGSYVRNPPSSRHEPGSGPGCVILVKLWQFDLDDRRGLRLGLDAVARAADPGRPGVEVQVLFDDPEERVRVETWAPGCAAQTREAGGVELLVLEGSLRWAGSEAAGGSELLSRWSWLRLPPGASFEAQAGPGARGCGSRPGISPRSAA